MTKEENNIIDISNIINEAERFIAKAREAKNRLTQVSKENYKPASFKEVAAMKRAALDLKRELTLITQMKSY